MGSDAVEKEPQAREDVSQWEDYVDILYAPSAVFTRRQDGNFWIPLLVVTVFFALLWMASVRVLEPVFDADWARQMERLIERNPQLSPEALEAQRVTVRNLQVVLAAVIVPLTILIVGFVLWLVGKVFEAKQTLRAAMVVAAFAYVPRVLEQGVAIAEGLVRNVEAIDGRNRLTWGVGRFMDPEAVAPQVLAVVSRIDVFTIWVTVLLAIGLAVTGRISGKRAAVAGVMMWVIGAVPTYIGMLTQ